MGRYEARINLYGKTQRERVVNRTMQQIATKGNSNLSLKDVKINGRDDKLFINTSTQTYYKEFESLHGQDINIGYYIDFANSKWIVTECDSDDELYKDGKIQQCNHVIKWQNDKGEIISRYAVVLSASKYNDGTSSNPKVTLGSDQLSVCLPIDEESVKLKKDMNIKFFIDNNKENPTTYELTGTGNVTDTYNGYGVTSWIVKECAYSPTPLDLKYWVCDYDPNKKKEDDIVLDENAIFINGGDTLWQGQERTWTVSFFNEFEDEIVPEFEWNVISDFDIKTETNKKSITLLSNDENAIGSVVTLQIIVDSKIVAHKYVKVKEVW